MTTSYNNSHRFHNQLDPLEESKVLNAIYVQLNQLNNCLTNYQISNNKTIESINLKVDLQLRQINEKLDCLSGEIKELNRKIATPTNDRYSNNRTNDKVLELFNKHINKLNSDIQELSSSLYSGNDISRQMQMVEATPLSNGGTGQGEVYKQHTSSELVHIDMNINNRNRVWPKSLNCRNLANLHNPEPSSQAENRFSFDKTRDPNKSLQGRTDTRCIIESQESARESGLDHQMNNIVQINNDILRNRNKNMSIEKSNIGDTQYIYPTQVFPVPPGNDLQRTEESFVSSADSTNSGRVIEKQIQGTSENQSANQINYGDFTNEKTQIDEFNRKSATVGIVTPKDYEEAPTTNIAKKGVWKPQSKSKTLDKSISSIKNNIPGSLLIKNKKSSTVPQYKLEKSLKNVSEIWQEYEYGINGKPPLKQLETRYSTKWRNETELRTYLRRKKIYDAIENGKNKGYSEKQVIEELEVMRSFEKFGIIKKKPLLWLYSNIPDKFT